MNIDIIVSVILCGWLLILLTKNIRSRILSMAFFIIGFFTLMFYMALLGVWEGEFSPIENIIHTVSENLSIDRCTDLGGTMIQTITGDPHVDDYACIKTTLIDREATCI